MTSRYRRKSGWRRIADLVGVALVIAVAVYVVRTLTPPSRLAAPQVIDGDSLRDGVEEIRLHGIDAPEYRQTCHRADGTRYNCGRQAARHLRSLIARSGAALECRIVDTDRYDRAVAVCSAGGRELNLAMVEDGWAVAYTDHALTYLAAERRARGAKRGLWQGWFDPPSQYRERNRAALGTAAPPDPLPPD